MKRVLFDHNVPARLSRFLKACNVKLADEMGWTKISNGEPLAAADHDNFDVLLTGDQSLRYEQNMVGRKIAVVSMSDNHWSIVQHHVPAIVEALEQAKPGEVRQVFCGTFVPRRLRKQLP